MPHGAVLLSTKPDKMSRQGQEEWQPASPARREAQKNNSSSSSPPYHKHRHAHRAFYMPPYASSGSYTVYDDTGRCFAPAFASAPVFVVADVPAPAPTAAPRSTSSLLTTANAPGWNFTSRCTSAYRASGLYAGGAPPDWVAWRLR